MRVSTRRRLRILLGLFFLMATVMGVGPGVLLINRPDIFWGLPLIYTWALFWYGVHVVIASVAYRTLWKSSTENSYHTEGQES